MARRSGTGARQPLLLSAPALLVIALLFAFPAVYDVVLSFQRLSPYDAPGDAVWVGFDNFVALFTSKATASAAWNTAFWLTAVTVVIRLVLGMGLALLLQSPVLRRWHLRGLCRTAVLVP